MGFDSQIKDITDKQKLEFLDKLLKNDERVKEQFIKYFNLEDKISMNYDDKELESLAKEIFEVFNGVDTELYMEAMGCGYGSYFGYYYEDIPEQISEDLFIEIEKRLDRHFKNNDFYQIFFVLLATSKAIDLEPEIEDNFGLIGDYYELLDDYFNSLVFKYYEKLKKSNLSFDNKKRLIYFLLDNSSSQDEISRFEYLFEELITSGSMAKQLSSRILEFNIDTQLKILNLLGDDEKYIQSAKKFYKEDSGVAKKLLSKLNEIMAYDEYERIAKECFKIYPSYFITDIFDVITYEKSPKFYLELLKYKVLNESSLEDYITYKKYLNQNELEKLQKSIFNSYYNIDFYIQILEYEKKYDVILKLAKNDKYDLNKTIKPIINYFPRECLYIIIKKSTKMLESVDRNRETYVQICKLLKIMIDVNEVKKDIELYIKTNLINRKPSLPTLKDELQKAGLV
ncbi:MAG: hypothetical protein ACQERD_01540 [Campylobacterota bacterium]